ncbi:hypothetical protein LOK49_LG08G03167 [Camellia lanceoleosa]|uniref:Uncharacterized protein n=1 Tax=Camellia lanceoleosa TaxID=1840588 RepID=A0ACC0GWS8_9ERIC|nr:hypothetical protein LOK49_LG08G03167 [Camellia lanceoleosa]
MTWFSKLLFRTAGDEDSILATSVLETPLDLKNSSLGKRVFSGSHTITGGSFLTRIEIWVLVKPWFSKNARTESGLSGVSKLTYFDAERAFSRGNPHEFTR